MNQTLEAEVVDAIGAWLPFMVVFALLTTLISALFGETRRGGGPTSVAAWVVKRATAAGSHYAEDEAWRRIGLPAAGVATALVCFLALLIAGVI